MNIGIYGDSYCKLNLEHCSTRGRPWFELLAESVGATEINNYGRPGASLMYAYNQYTKTKHLNDLNVFVIPSLVRFYSEKLESIFRNVDSCWYVSLSAIKNTMASFYNHPGRDYNSIENQKIKKIFDSIVVYFEHWKDIDSDCLLNKTFALDLINKEKNTIFLYTDGKLFSDEFTLLDLSQWEMNKLGWYERFTAKDIHYGTIIDGKWLGDARVCHLSEENNIILANKIKETMDSGNNVVRLNVNDFVVPSKSLDAHIGWYNI